jgi:hypothetical protein
MSLRTIDGQFAIRDARTKNASDEPGYDARSPTRLPMTRIVLTALAIAALAACEPVTDIDEQSPGGDTRFSEADLATPSDDNYLPPPEDIQSNPTDEPWVDPSTQPLTLRAGFLRGAVGPVIGLADDANDLQGTQMDGWTTVQTTVSDSTRLAMTIVELMGNLDQLERGKTYTYGVDGYAAEDPNAPWLAIVGCSAADNPEEGLDFDQSAEEVSITVDEPDETSLDVAYDARFVEYDEYGRASAETMVHGRFTMDR